MTENQLKIKLAELRALPGETEIVEFKEAKNDYDFNKLGKYFSALCNEANLKGRADAWLVFGIENKQRNVVGSHYRSINRVEIDSLKKEIAAKTTNGITFIEIYELTLSEGRVIMFQIPAAPRGIPIGWSGHYYGRNGEELSPLNIEEIERIRKQSTNVDWSSEICAGASLSDLDVAAIAKARENYKVKNPKLVFEVDEWDDSTFLNKAKITIGGQVTRTTIILLGKPESEHFISPGVARITWVLKDKSNIEKDYQHFSCPFLLAMDQVNTKIRNLKYRYMKDGTLFPEEVDQYDNTNIKEALSNCIAHQDYSLGGRITVTENEDGYLSFSNPGSFIPGSIENVILSDEPPVYYRNSFLSQAMVNLNMIDTIGSGIKRMFRVQGERFFPMPDYDLSGNKVKATLTGKVLDVEFARVLARNKNLTLLDIVMLDKVQKKKDLTEEEIKHLKVKGLIEGRKPNFYISAKLAQVINHQVEYFKSKGVDDEFIRKTILDYISKFSQGKKTDFEKILLPKISDTLTERQKKDKIKNALQALKREGKINNEGKIWSKA